MYKEFFVIIYLSYDMVSKARISQKGVLPPPPHPWKLQGRSPLSLHQGFALDPLEASRRPQLPAF